MARFDHIPSGIRILVADDYALTRAMVQSILKSVGLHNVTQAENGAMAMKKIEDDQIELVICDWNMPEYSGLEVLKFMRGIERYRDVPFLMLTAEGYRGNVREAVSAGVTDYIVKPFTADVLLNKISEVFPC